MVVGMNLLPFSTQQSTAQTFDSRILGFYAKETKYSPTTVHFKDYGAMDACGGFNAV